MFQCSKKNIRPAKIVQTTICKFYQTRNPKKAKSIFKNTHIHYKALSHWFHCIYPMFAWHSPSPPCSTLLISLLFPRFPPKNSYCKVLLNLTKKITAANQRVTNFRASLKEQSNRKYEDSRAKPQTVKSFTPNPVKSFTPKPVKSFTTHTVKSFTTRRVTCHTPNWDTWQAP